MKIAPPANIQNLSAFCGWFDGRITIVRFTSDVATIRKLLPRGIEPHLLLEDPSSTDPNTGIEARWRMGTQPGWIVDRSLAPFPDWKTPWCAEWSLPSLAIEPSRVRIVWDEQTGQAIVVSLKD